jgi:undecaprenyl pyrophosphate phosphatase UppP
MPGTSRSAASIIGGMQQKLSREAAAEFSLFLNLEKHSKNRIILMELLSEKTF